VAEAMAVAVAEVVKREVEASFKAKGIAVSSAISQGITSATVFNIRRQKKP